MKEEDFIVEFKQDYKKSWESAVSEIYNLKSQLKAKEDLIKEAREYIEEETKSEAFHHYLNDEDLEHLLEILSKGENK